MTTEGQETKMSSDSVAEGWCASPLALLEYSRQLLLFLSPRVWNTSPGNTSMADGQHRQREPALWSLWSFFAWILLNSSHSFVSVHLTMFSLEPDWQWSGLTRPTEWNLQPVFIPIHPLFTHLGNAELLQSPLQREWVYLEIFPFPQFL